MADVYCDLRRINAKLRLLSQSHMKKAHAYGCELKQRMNLTLRPALPYCGKKAAKDPSSVSGLPQIACEVSQ